MLGVLRILCTLLHKIHQYVSQGLCPLGLKTSMLDISMHIACLLTLWSRVLLEKLTSSQLVKKFPTFYGTQRFVTAFTNVCHLYLS